MDVNQQLKELRKKKLQLQKKQQALLHQLQSEHKDIYDWFLANHLDITNLGQYSAKLATALFLAVNSISPISPPVVQAIPIPSPTPQVRIIEKDELKGLTEDERALLVWSRYGHFIRQAADKYNLDPRLIFATIMIESGGNTYAIRHEPRINDASYGLGQILYGTAKGIGFKGKPTDLYNPEINIDLIAKYHRRNLDRHGNTLTVDQLTTAYNTGSPHKKALPGHLKKFRKWYDRVANLEVYI